MGGVRSSEGVRPLEGEARALEMVGRRARARGAGRSGVRSAWYHLQAERAVGRCAQQCEGRRAPAGGGEPSSALGIASEKTRAARAARAGRAEPGCAQAGGSSPSGAPRASSQGRSFIHSRLPSSFTTHHHAKGHTKQKHHTSHTSHPLHSNARRRVTHTALTDTDQSRHTPGQPDNRRSEPVQPPRQTGVWTVADTQTQHIQLHRLKGEWMAEVNRLWSAARRIQKEGLRRPRSQRTSHRRADGGADEEEGGRGQGTERDATIDGQRQQGLDVRQSQGRNIHKLIHTDRNTITHIRRGGSGVRFTLCVVSTLRLPARRRVASCIERVTVHREREVAPRRRV